MPAVLPGSLQSKLDQLASRERRQRMLRGLGRVTLVAIASVGAAVALDAWLTLSPLARVPLALAVIALIVAAAKKWLIVPMNRRVDSATLAAAVEAEYPRLDERLSSSVELADRNGDAYGSPVLIDLLLRETELKTRTIDFERAAPKGRGRGVFVALAAAAAFCIGAAVIWPELMAGLGRRFFLPWTNRAAFEPFSIVVTSSGDVVGQGRTWSVAAELMPRRSDAKLPENCTLIVTPAGKSPMRLRMRSIGEGKHEFALDRVADNFRFQIESSPVVTESFEVQVVPAVEIADVRIELTPPEYARLTIANRQIKALSDVSVLQHSRVKWSCRFDRPANNATLILRTGESEQRIPLALSDDRLNAASDRTITSSGRYQIHVEGERGVVTNGASNAIRCEVDRPPEFLRVSGLGESLREVRASDELKVDLILSDDIALSSAAMEWRVNDGPVQIHPLPVPIGGKSQIAGPMRFPLAGKVQPGDRFACRLRIADNRSVPEANLGPQLTYFPGGDQWCEWQIVAQASPLRDRDIEAQRDAVDQKLKDLVSKLDKDRQAMADLGFSSDDKAAEKLQELQKSNERARQDLEKLAKQADMQGMPALADAARSVADRELKQADEFLKDAAAMDKDRAAATKQAERATAQAREQLERMRADNQRLAQQRLDASQVEKLADQQSQLAAEAQSAAEAQKQEELKNEQKGLAEDLDKMTKENQSAKEALRTATAEEAKKLSDHAKDLAKAERDLDDAIRESLRSQNAAKLAGAAKKQEELKVEFDRLAKQTQRALKAAQAPPPETEDAALSTEKLKRGEADEARNHQQRTADTLEKLADRLQQALDSQRDPREAARQLGRLQEETRKRTLDSSRPDAPGRDEILTDQQALQRAIERLAIPEDQGSAMREQIDASGKAKQAITALQNGHPNTAAELMKQARESLDRIANSLPSLPDRQKKARAALDKLRKEQEQLAKEARPAAERNPTRKESADFVQRQTELAERIAKLDAVNAGDQQEAARSSAGDALDDIMAGRWSDVDKSQDELKRDLQRLDDALRGQPPAADANAKKPDVRQESAATPQDLAQRQRDLAAATAAIPKQIGQARTDALDEAARRQRELRNDASRMPSGASPKSIQEARLAMAQAEQALARQEPDAAKQQQFKAAAALEQAARATAKRDAGNDAPTPSGLATSEQVQQARDLAKRQRELEQQVKETAASTPPPAGADKQQDDLANQTEELARNLQQHVSPPASNHAQQAIEAMRAAMNQQLSDPSEARKSRQRAAEALDRAAEEAERKSQSEMRAGSPNAPPQGQSGQALIKARGKMQDAQKQLDQGKNEDAAKEMQGAADALKKAAQEMRDGGQQGQSNSSDGASNPNAGGNDGKQLPVSPDVAKELSRHAGKKWGELPGELRTKIMEDVKSQYGEDYARIIRLYFESLADRK